MSPRPIKLNRLGVLMVGAALGGIRLGPGISKWAV